MSPQDEPPSRSKVDASEFFFDGSGLSALLIHGLTGTPYVSQPASAKTIGLVRLEEDYPEYHDLATRAVTHDDGHDQDALMHLAAYTFRTYGPRRDA